MFNIKTFNIKTEKYPYRKQNNSLHYIHKHSNHPPSIIKQISSMIIKQLPDISSDKHYFDNAAPIYNEQDSGFNRTF